jgi:hypothetical protein
LAAAGSVIVVLLIVIDDRTWPCRGLHAIASQESAGPNLDPATE